MGEETSAHYALKIAVTILRERCQLFQRRIAVLEEENMNLKLLCQKNDNNQDSLTQIDSLKRHIASVVEENSNLQSRIKIMSQENRQLWSNLGKLTQMNKSLGSHLNKINDTLSQHVTQHQPLIRSKTFTQDKPHTELEIFKENELVKLDLEDISLKLINSMGEVKQEMDSLVQNMTDVEILDNIITSSLGLSYEDENDDIIEDLKIILEEFHYIKNESEKQNVFLKESLNNIRNKKLVMIILVRLVDLKKICKKVLLLLIAIKKTIIHLRNSTKYFRTVKKCVQFAVYNFLKNIHFLHLFVMLNLILKLKLMILIVECKIL
ncbi:hypothetical protein HHI36_016068 [Cryptolaemus montrouzieri]|uniref:Uncharacterized protein n=1 Tax=Cryptolaemus montrouzieri TaxID=559131 RepID=A0ABD2N7X5_9CUCU